MSRNKKPKLYHIFTSFRINEVGKSQEKFHTQKIFAQRNPLQHTFFSFRLFHSSATILEVLFASHLGHSSISPTICIQYNTWCSVFIFHVDFFRWNSCRRAKDEQPPEIRPVLKSTHFFLATFFSLSRFLFLFSMRCDEKTIFFTFVNCKLSIHKNFVLFFLANSRCSLIKHMHLFPMPFILSTLIFILR